MLQNDRNPLYIRNSVKIVIHAYNGTVDFYLADASDPIAATLPGPNFVGCSNGRSAGLAPFKILST
jgi:Uncharacterised protein family (UPF0182)